jgi:hypothetical protein
LTHAAALQFAACECLLQRLKVLEDGVAGAQRALGVRARHVREDEGGVLLVCVPLDPVLGLELFRNEDHSLAA